MGYRISYYDKDGSGFCGTKEPYLLWDYVSLRDAQADAEDMKNAGFKNVKVLKPCYIEVE